MAGSVFDALNQTQQTEQVVPAGLITVTAMGDTKVVHPNQTVDYKVIFRNESDQPKLDVKINAAIPDGTELVADSVALVRKNKSRVNVGNDDPVINTSGQMISTVLQNFRAGEKITLSYKVGVKKSSGYILQRAWVDAVDNSNIESKPLINIVLPEKDLNEAWWLKRECFSKGFVINLLDKPDDNLKKVLPTLGESVDYYLQHQENSNAYDALKNAVLSFDCVQVPADYVVPRVEKVVAPVPDVFTQEVVPTQELTQESQQVTQEITQQIIEPVTSQETVLTDSVPEILPEVVPALTPEPIAEPLAEAEPQMIINPPNF